MSKKSLFSAILLGLSGTFLSLVLCIFCPIKPVLAEVNAAIPMPAIDQAISNELTIRPGVVISGQALNFTKIKATIDGQVFSEVKIAEGNDGWQKFYITINNLSVGIHQLNLTAEYFKGLSSPVNIIKLIILEKIIGPTLFDPVLNNDTNFRQPWIIGVVPNSCQLEIIIDEKLAGSLTPLDHQSGTTSFRYQPPKLADGYHVVKAQAINNSGAKSDWSNEIIFKVEQNIVVNKAPGLIIEKAFFIPPVPAPTLTEPVSGAVIPESDPVEISGLVHNNHWVEIFIDDEMVAQFMPASHVSGVTNFSWISSHILAPGIHKVYARATNKAGIASNHSNIIKWLILPTTPVFISHTTGYVSSDTTVQQPTEENPEIKIIEDQNNNLFTKKTGPFYWWVYLLVLIMIGVIGSIINWQRKIIKQEQTEVKKEGTKEVDDPVAVLKEEVDQRKQDQ